MHWIEGRLESADAQMPEVPDQSPSTYHLRPKDLLLSRSQKCIQFYLFTTNLVPEELVHSSFLSISIATKFMVDSLKAGSFRILRRLMVDEFDEAFEHSVRFLYEVSVH